MLLILIGNYSWVVFWGSLTISNDCSLERDSLLLDLALAPPYYRLALFSLGGALGSLAGFSSLLIAKSFRGMSKNFLTKINYITDDDNLITYLFGDPVWVPSLQSFDSDDIITHAIFGFKCKLQYKV